MNDPAGIPGFARLRTGGGTTTIQTTHLVRYVNGGTPGPTVCGKTRFDKYDPITGEITDRADIPGWGMEGGVFGPAVTQVACPECYAQAGPAATIERPAGL